MVVPSESVTVRVMRIRPFDRLDTLAAAVAERLSLPAVVMLWVLMSLPHLGLRAFHFEEGRSAMQATALIETNGWFVDRVAGERFVQRLPLQPWLIALASRLTGGVGEWAVRLPALVSMLATTVVVFAVTRGAAGAQAAAFAAAAFVTSIGVIERSRLGEPDSTIMFLSFAAFAIWHRGLRSDRMGWMRAAACALLMTAVCGLKGPQPCAYFLGGACAFALLRRRSGDGIPLAVVAALPAAVFAAWLALTWQPGDGGRWLVEMRLAPDVALIDYVAGTIRLAGQIALEWLPPALFAVAFWAHCAGRRSERNRELGVELALYAGVATTILVLWPGAHARYALPALPAVAVAAGLGFDELRHRHPRVLSISMAAGSAAATYQVVLVAGVMTVAPSLFTRNRDVGLAMMRAIHERPAPVYAAALGHNVAAYLRVPVTRIAVDRVREVVAPAWILALDGQLAEIVRSDSRVGPPILLSTVTDPSYRLAPLERAGARIVPAASPSATPAPWNGPK